MTLDLLSLLLGLVLGLSLGWVVSRLLARKASSNTSPDPALQTLQTTLATLEERLRGREATLAERDQQLTKATQATNDLRLQLSTLRTETATAEARLKEEKRALEQRIEELNQLRTHLQQTLRESTAEALKSNSRHFLENARQTFDQALKAAREESGKRQELLNQSLSPFKERLTALDSKLAELEKSREGAYQGLVQQVKSLHQSQQHLQGETRQLVEALRSPNVRGRWGEIQLRRVVEFAGMIRNVDFHEQSSINVADDTRRPDLTVHLPGGKTLFVDSKVPWEKYHHALSAPTAEARTTALADFAKAVQAQIRNLGSKSYWQGAPNSPEFTILFIPGEALFAAALEADPSLIEQGADHRVILATPTTLIGLLRAVAYGWQQEAMTREVTTIIADAKELYRRLGTFADKYEDIGKRLGQTVKAYNGTVGSFERTLLPAATRFARLKPDELGLPEAPATVDEPIRDLTKRPEAEDPPSPQP